MAVPQKFLIPLGDRWVFKMFDPDGGLTMTLQEAPDLESGTQLSLEATELHFSPRSDPGSWLSSLDLDKLVEEASKNARDLVSQPGLRAAQWALGTKRGRSTPGSFLTDVVTMRKTMSAAEIAKKLGRSESQVFRYLQIARNRGITAEGDNDGSD